MIMSSSSSSSSSSSPSSPPPPAKRVQKDRHVLIIECQPRVNWTKLFDCETGGSVCDGARSRSVTLSDNSGIIIHQTVWDDLSVWQDASLGALCCLRKRDPKHGYREVESSMFTPDLVLLRSVVRSVGSPPKDSRKKMYALMLAGIPALNSWHATYQFLERPVVSAALHHQCKSIPMIKSSFYPSFRNMMFPPADVGVLKIGYPHAGYGKVKYDTQEKFMELRSVVAVSDEYCSAEPFIDYECDIRIQKIGRHVRVFERRTSSWKGNMNPTGMTLDWVQPKDVPERYLTWIKEASDLWGGVEICALDVLREKESGKEHVLELNEGAIGLVGRFEPMDHERMKDLVVDRLNRLYTDFALPESLQNSLVLDESCPIEEKKDIE